MSVEVMQWLRGELDKPIEEAKQLTLDFVSRLNEEVIRLEAWVHDLKGGALADTLKAEVAAHESTKEVLAATQHALAAAQAGTPSPVQVIAPAEAPEPVPEMPAVAEVAPAAVAEDPQPA
jgi:Ni,Fe-hydrogenase III component G